jgi:Domain of unknown function (DUF4124)
MASFPMDSRVAVILVLAALSPVAFGEIYKTVDANGNVVFTDIAPVDRSGQPPQEVTVPQVNSYEPPPASAAQPNAAPAASGDVGYYAQLEVISPSEDETLRDNAGNVQIQVVIAPPLRADHRLLLVLDGNGTEVEAVNGVFELSNVERGTHTASGRVVDRQGNVVIESNPTTFNLMRDALPQESPGLSPHNG